MSVFSGQDISVYRKTHQNRFMQKKERMNARKNSALTLSKKAAYLLKTKYHVKQVYLFGSLARQHAFFDEHSDIDIAVKGLPEKDYFKAHSNLMDLNPKFDMDLVMMETASTSILKVICQEGILI
ncbi:MAG: nucleotidyltransferase domain-containing protein [Candidatus Magnetomorum sp.]|nr:nucleotidyltransferase domain-containing protein [Candidatus Magnetomorum sp.]